MPGTVRPYLLTLAAIGAAWALLAHSGPPSYDPDVGINTMLPSSVGIWRGSELHYCSSEKCGQVLTGDQLGAATNCPACGGPLDNMAPAERQLLPRDTQLSRFQYAADGGRKIYASIVLSGKNRASIHRPENCHSGQIVDSQRIAIPLDDRAPLFVTMLTERDVIHGKEFYGYFAYWFVAPGRETPSHTQRMFWMACDNLFRNVTHRWAYISVAGEAKPGSDQHINELRTFVRALYPRLMRDERKFPKVGNDRDREVPKIGENR